MEIIRSELIDKGQPLRSAADILRQSLDQGERDLTGSLANCHVPGMDSIVLHDNRIAAGGMARIFIARRGAHKLGEVIDEDTGNFVLGVHNHRFPLTIVPLLGEFINYEVTPDPDGSEILHRYTFTSGITGTMGVDYLGEVRTRPPVLNDQMPGGFVHMESADLHTVVIPDAQTKHDMTAWLVLEEPEERTANIYGKNPRLMVDSKGLYHPIDPAEARATIEQIVSEIS